MKALRYSSLLLIASLLAGGLAGTALGTENFNLDTAHSYVFFKVSHLGLANSYGRFQDISGTIAFDEANPANNKFVFMVAAESLDTGTDKRDMDLRSTNFFDVAKHPTITFVSSQVKKLGEDRFEVTGDITLLGITRRVTTEVLQTGEGNDPWGNHRRGFESHFTLKRSEFDMNHLLNSVSDEVYLTVSVEGMRKP